MASSTKLCLTPVYKNGDYINAIDELKETLDDPVFGTIPKYSAIVGVGSTYSYNTQKIPYNGMSYTKGTPTQDGTLTVTSTYQLYSWVNGSGTSISGTDYQYLIFLEFYTNNITSVIDNEAIQIIAVMEFSLGRKEELLKYIHISTRIPEGIMQSSNLI